MKRILFFLVTLLFVNLAKAQEIVDYYIGDIVVGDKYEYKLYKYRNSLSLRNTADIEYITKNGQKQFIITGFENVIKFSNPYVVIEAIETVFSKEEILEMAKACVEFERKNYDRNSNYSYFYSFDPDVDKNGKIVNLSIGFNNCDAMRNVPPQKIEQLEDYIKKNAVYTIKSKEFAERLQIISAQPIEVDVNNTDYSFKLMYDTNKY